MHKIRVHGLPPAHEGLRPGGGRDWSGVREALVLILFFVLLAVAAFEGGYIYRDREAASGPEGPPARWDELRKQVHQLDIKTGDINGRLVGVETTLKKIGR